MVRTASTLAYQLVERCHSCATAARASFAASEPTRARPVVLATMAVRVDPSAERMAIDSALEAGVPLLMVNLIPLPLYPATMVLLGPEGTTLPHEEDLDAVRATAARAAELGVKTELLRVRTRHAVGRAAGGGSRARRRPARVRATLGRSGACASAGRRGSGGRPTAWSGSRRTADMRWTRAASALY